MKIVLLLTRARNEINKIIEEDLRKIKDLTIRQNKSIAFNEFTKPASIIRMAFYIEGVDLCIIMCHFILLIGP